VLSDISSGETAVFADVNLVSSLLVSERWLHPMNLVLVAFQRAALRKALVALRALVWLHSSMGANVTLEIERIVESFSAKVAFVLLEGQMIPSMTIQHSDVLEGLSAKIAGEIRKFRLSPVFLLFNLVETCRMDMLALI